MIREAVLACALAAGCGPATTPAAAHDSVTNRPASLRLPDEIDGPRLRALLDAHRGQPIVVNVFASWCEPCRRELPGLAQLSRENPRLFLLAIDVDEADRDRELAQFLAIVPSSFHVVRHRGGIGELLAFLVPDGKDEIPKEWEQAVPLTLVFDSTGTLQCGSVGELGADALAAARDVVAGRSGGTR